MRLEHAALALVFAATCSLAWASGATAQTPARVGDEDVPAAPVGPALHPARTASDAEGSGARELADPLALDLRAHELDALIAADAQAAATARTFGAASGYAIGAIGIGATPVLFALDDGSGLLPILSIVTLQLGALGLATAILSSISSSTEERRLVRWRELRRGGRPGLADLARFEGFLVADADRAADARLMTIAQGVASLATGLFTGLVGLFATHAEVTQITLGTLGGVEILIGLLQLIGGLEAGAIESRPAQYESRTGIRITWNGSALMGSF